MKPRGCTAPTHYALLVVLIGLIHKLVVRKVSTDARGDQTGMP